MVGITKLSTYLMTMPQVKMTERESLPPVMLFTTVVGISAFFIESRLNLSGSSMLTCQMNTARAGMTPRPRERRQTAPRWLGPKLQFNPESRISVKKR